MAKYTTQEIPYGYCQCGCGQKTKTATKTRKEAGWIKGEPLRFLSGHQSLATVPKDDPNPSGFCHCGCGQTTPVADRSNAKLGHIKGCHVRFILGHALNLRTIRPVADRFWEKVDKRGTNDCWDWQAGGDQHGYGQLNVDGRAVRAHRISYELHYGPIPDGLDCLHTCDRPPCCNPAHLFVGTAKDNSDDMHKKGRFNKVQGERVGNAFLTNAQAREFRRMFKESNMSITAFATFHGVPVNTMWNVLRYKTYKND